MSTATNSPVVATVVSVTGVAFARNADGAVRRLAAGDTILQGEIVFTLADSQVELAFSDGHSATILASESYLMGPEAMIATSPDAGAAAIAAAGEVEKVVQALEEGADVLQELEAPAAGAAGGGDEGGHSFVRLLRISEGVNPVGFDYPLNPIGYIRAPEFEAIPEEEEPPVNGLPDISAGNATMDEEDVMAGGNPGDSYTDGGDMGEWNATGTLNVDYGPDGAGSLAISATNYAATWNAGTNTLSANDGSWTLVYNPATNEYAFNLLKPLAHPEANTEDDWVLNFTATVTDSNGDSESASFMVTVDDDAPVRAEVENEPASISAFVEEDDLSRADAVDPDLSDGNNEDLSADADQASSNVLYGSLASLVSVGADKPLSFSLEDTATVNELLPALYSNGAPVSYAVSTVADTDGDGKAESVLTATADGRTVFTLTVNSGGTWMFDLDDQLDHLNDGANDENWELVSDSGPIAAIDFTKVLVAADADGDELPWTENDVNVFTVAVQDDIPVAWGADYTRAAHPNGSTALCTAGGKLFYADGADEAATVAFDYTTVAGSRMADEVGLTVVDKFGSGLTSSTSQLYWVVSDGEGGYVAFGSPGFESATTLYAATYDDMADSFNTPVFTVALDGMNGTYTITVEGIMDLAARSIDIDLTGGVSGGNAGWYLLGAVELNNAGEETFNDGSTHNDVLVYALGAAETINSRQGGLGAGIKGGGGDASLFIHEADGNPEGVQFNFVEGLVFDKHDYDDDDNVVEPNTQSYRSLDSVTVTMGATQGNDPTSIKVLAYDASHNLVPITVTSGDGTAYLYDPDGAGGQDPYWVVDGLTQGETFTVSASSPDGVSILEVWYHHSTVDYDGDSENDDPAGFLLSSLMYSVGIVGSTIDMALPYTVTDYDGDTVVAGMDFAIDPEGEVIHVAFGESYEGDETAEIVYGDVGAETISGGEGDDVLVGRCGDDELHGNEGNDILVGGGSLPSEPGVTDNDVLYGDAGNDSLHGGSGDDLLAGGSGSDTLTGGFGADTFAWMPGDESTPAPIDRITDFDMAAHSDKLDLSDLLQGEEGMGAEGLADYLSFSYDSVSNSTTIEVRSDGVGNIDQYILLEGVDLTLGGTLTTDAQIIQSLLDNGKLVTD